MRECVLLVGVLVFSLCFSGVFAEDYTETISQQAQVLIQNKNGACWIREKGSRQAEQMDGWGNLKKIGEYPNMAAAKKGWKEHGCRKPA